MTALLTSTLLFGASTADPSRHLEQISGFLGSYYLLLALMNGLAALYLWIEKKRPSLALVWLLLAGFLVVLSPLAMSATLSQFYSFPQWFKDVVNTVSGSAVIYSLGTMVALVVLFIFRRFFVKPVVAWAMLNATLILMGFAMTDPNFWLIVSKGDNVPIVGLVYLLGFFTWLATAKAVENDDRIRLGLPPKEKLNNEKVLVWPDLVYTELICMVALTAFLLVWAILLQAPLEEPASSVKTPNPSKAPWYFLGLQEMLVYYDPWYAGVVLPSLVIFGLMAIPFIDFNKKGNGYYTIEERKFSYLVFQFGFLELWITLIVLGTFMRGPNWNIYGLLEYWDPHKVEVLNNVDLSQYFWVYMLDMNMPRAEPGSGFATEVFWIIVRELPGIILTGAYFLILPPVLAVTVFRNFFVRMGFIRFMLMTNLFLFMMTLPLKMVLRWTVNLKYIISIPEYFLNF